ncbi:hypothetical protein ACQZ6F_06910 [Rhizobium sp. A22-96]
MSSPPSLKRCRKNVVESFSVRNRQPVIFSLNANYTTKGNILPVEDTGTLAHDWGQSLRKIFSKQLILFQISKETHQRIAERRFISGELLTRG